MVFLTAVATTRKWDSIEAGKDLAEKLAKKLEGKTPTAILLFTTIHYKEHGGFQNLLTEFHKGIPTTTPLIGGTITGFINNDGCYTRGATAYAIHSDEITVTTGIGHNTKRNPKKAAQDCAKTLKTDDKTFIFQVMSNGTLPTFPILGRKRVYQMPIIDGIVMRLFAIFNQLFQFGVGREKEVFEEFSKNASETSILSLANYDNNKSESNFQFFNKEIFDNSLISIAFSANKEPNVRAKITTTFGLIPSGKKLTADNFSLFNCSIGKINGKPATTEIMKQLSWNEAYLDERIYRRTYYYPLVSTVNGQLLPHVMGLFIGNSISFTYSLDQKDLEVYYASGRNLCNAIEKDLDILPDDSKIILGVGCTSQLEMLGAHVYDIEKILKKKTSKSFLILYGAGEGVYLKEKGANYMNQSFNLLTF